MTWVMVGTTVGSGLLSAGASNKAGLAGSKQSYLNEALGWEENIAQNKAIGEANLQNTIRTGYRMGLLNIQQAQARKEASTGQFTIGRRKQSLLGAASASAAASGTFGSSVDAITSDIAQKADEALNNQGEAYATQVQNFDTQLHDLLMSGQDALQSPAKTNVQSGQAFEGTSIGESLVQSGLQLGGQYLSAKMKLGLGEPTYGAFKDKAGAIGSGSDGRTRTITGVR